MNNVLRLVPVLAIALVCSSVRAEVVIHELAQKGELAKLEAFVKSVEPEVVAQLINAPDENGMTPLHHAVIFNNVDVVKFLLKLDANPDTRDLAGSTPLLDARSKDVHDLLEDAMAVTLEIAHSRKARTPLIIDGQWASRATPSAPNTPVHATPLHTISMLLTPPAVASLTTPPPLHAVTVGSSW